MVLICSCQYSTTSSKSTFSDQLILDTASSVTTGEFYPMYLGEYKEVVSLSYVDGMVRYNSNVLDTKGTTDTTYLKIVVDTTQFIGAETSFSIPRAPKDYEIESDETIWSKRINEGKNKSYPIFVQNDSQGNLTLGWGDYVSLFTEAKDSLGKWQVIQEPYTYTCGTGLSKWLLRPQEMLLTQCKLFDGDYETTMRVVFKFDTDIKSNEFQGKINYKQFSEPSYTYF